MGKKMDALLGRTFKTSKFKTVVNLAISRLAVLKNQRQVRCSHARSDTSQLLNLGHQDRALLRIEHVIKEQNMLDVFVMLEGYCHVLIERVVLIENNKICPDELKEAISSLIFAASRCGEFPELQEIREVFISRFGKDFAARAVELRNSCGVNPKIIQKLSTRQPNLETRMKVLQEIASEKGIVLHLEEESSVQEEKKAVEQKQNQPEPNVSSNSKFGDESKMDREEQFSDSMKARTKYASVASAAQAAFESAAYAAAAARAAMELSRSESQDNFSDDESCPAPRRRNRFDNDGSSTSRLGNIVGTEGFGEVEDSNEELAFEKIHSVDKSDSESESEELPQIHDKVPPKDFKERQTYDKLERSLSSSSLDSVKDSLKETKKSSNVLGQNEYSEKISFDTSDDETKQSRIPRSDHSVSVDANPDLSINKFPKIRKTNTPKDSGEVVHPKRLNIERRPLSVRTRRGHGQ